MNIPLGVLEAGGLSIPISVINHGEPMRVGGGNADCGIGWSLIAGGAITREVRGLPDEYNTSEKKGWLYTPHAQSIQTYVPTANDNLSDCVDEVTDYHFLETVVENYKYDTEPDIFRIAAPGVEASFVFDQHGIARFLGSQDYSLEANLLNGVNIILRTQTGLVYYFSNTYFGTASSLLGDRTVRTGRIFENGLPLAAARYFEKEEDRYGADTFFEFPQSWALEKIVSEVTGSVARFKYGDFNAEENFYESPKIEVGKHYLTADSLSTITDVYSFYKLKEITLASYKATFGWADNGILAHFSISSENSDIIKNVQMHYVNIAASSKTKHLLSSVEFKNSRCEPGREYKFDYELIDVNEFGERGNLPEFVDWKKYWGMDIWGYHNGITYPHNDDLPKVNLPTLYFYAQESDGRRLRTHAISGLSNPSIINGRGREGNMTYAALGLLKKVVHPDGGTTEITYQPNTYWDSSIGTSATGPGFRVVKIVSHGGDPAYGRTIAEQHPFRSITREFEYINPSTGVTSGLIMEPLKLGFILRDKIVQTVNNVGNEPFVYYTHVKEIIPGKGYTLTEHEVTGFFPEVTSGEWRATKSRVARKQTVPCNFGYLRNGYYLFPFPSSTNNYRNGFLKKVSSFSATGTLLSEKVYTPVVLTKNPSIVKGIRFEKISDTYYYGIYEIITGKSVAVATEISKEANQEEPGQWLHKSITYTYNNSNRIQSVTTSLPNNTTQTVHYKYAGDFMFTGVAPTDTAAYAIQQLNVLKRAAELIEQYSVSSQPGVVNPATAAAITLFRDFGAGKVLPYYIKRLPPGADFTPSSQNGQSFVHDPDYRTVRTMKTYDLAARPLTEWDDNRQVSGHHYFSALNVPSLSTKHARAEHILFEAFESKTSFGLDLPTSDFDFLPGWTGQKSFVFKSSNARLISSSHVMRGSHLYRASCWMFAGSGKWVKLDFKNGGTLYATTTITNTQPGKWAFYEVSVNAVAFPNTFSVEIYSNASATETVRIDDFTLAPAHAVLNTQTFVPLQGVTSKTDDSGNSVVQTFDAAGRPLAMYDQNRNKVEQFEYAEYNPTVQRPYAGFESDTRLPVTGSVVIFRPNETSSACESEGEIVFTWKVNGNSVSPNPDQSLSYIFTAAGNNTVTLTATNNNGSHTSSITYCVGLRYTGSFDLRVADSNGNPATLLLDCNSGFREVSITGLDGNLPEGCNFSVFWYKSTETGIPLSAAPFYKGSSLGFFGESVSQTTTYYYVVKVFLDCHKFDACFMAEDLQELFSKDFAVVQQFKSNCQ